MFETKWAWTAAGVLIGAPLLLFAAGALHWPSGTLGVDQIEATGHSVDVTIALCAAYLALDRTRLHTRTDAVIATVNSIYAKAALLGAFDRGIHKLDEERCLLIVLCMAGDPHAQSIAKIRQDELKNVPYYSSVNARALKNYLVRRLDRKLIFIVLVLLCFWQLAATCNALHPWTPAVQAHFIWVVLFVISLGYALPALGWLFSEMSLEHLTGNVTRWAGIIAAVRNEKLDSVIPLDLPPPPAVPIAPRTKKALTKRRPTPRPGPGHGAQ